MNMIPFRTFFENFQKTEYTPNPSDIFFHGSLRDFEDLEGGLAYVTRNLAHAVQYAEPVTIGGFGSRKMTDNGFIYSYKIKPSAKIFNATNKENVERLFGKGSDFSYGYTEIVQDPEYINTILDNGWDGILQKQADENMYGALIPKSRLRKELVKDGKKYNRETYRAKIPLNNRNLNYDQYSGTVVLGIKPEFLIPLKKIPLNDVFDDRHKIDYNKVKK